MKVLLTATVQSHICQFHKPLVKLLHENGCEVHVAARDNLAEKNGLKLDFVDKVFNVPFSRSPKSVKNIEAYKQLKKIIKSEHYDIIHCNTPMGAIVTRLAAVKARKNGTKVYYTAHGFHFYKGAPKKNWIFYYPVEKLFTHLTDKLITIADEDYLFAQKHFKCSVYRIHGVGVDSTRFYPVSKEEKTKLREALGYEPDDKIILCIGELLKNKNQQMIIRAMAEVVKKFSDVKLLIAGNGPLKSDLEKLINSLKLEKNIFMLGYRTDIEVFQHISDLLVSCSIREGLGLNAVEAMMCGDPVVLSDNRGHRELTDDGKNGYLVPVNVSDTMAEKVIELLSDRKKSNELSENALHFSQLYCENSVIKELRDIYEF